MVRGTEEHKHGQYPHHQTHSIQDGCVLEAQGEIHLVMGSIAGVTGSISLNTRYIDTVESMQAHSDYYMDGKVVRIKVLVCV